MTSHSDNFDEEKNFGEFRRKVKSAEVLSASMERLLMSLGFTGKVMVVMQNGRAQVGLRGRLLPSRTWWDLGRRGAQKLPEWRSKRGKLGNDLGRGSFDRTQKN